MVCTCSVTGCSNFARSGSGISFHKFPSDPVVCQQWLKAMKRENFKPSEFSKICSAHFNREDFNINFGSKKLKRHAVPSIFETSVNLVKRPSNTIRKNLNEKQNKEKVCEGSSAESSTKENDIVRVNSDTRTLGEGSSPVSVTPVKERISETPESVGNIFEDNVSIPTQQAEEPSPPIDITLEAERTRKTSNVRNIVKKNVIPIQPGPKPSVPIAINSGLEGTREVLVSVGNNLHKYVMIPMQLDEKLSAPVPLGTTSGVELSEGTTLKKYVMMPLQTVNGLTSQPTAEFTLPLTNSSPPKRKRSAYMGDVGEGDFRNAKQFKYMWEVATRTVEKQRKTIKHLRTKLYRLQKRLDRLNNYSIRIIIDE